MRALGYYYDVPHRFTGKERDSESGLDNFGARYNASTMGRFMSPDPGNIGVNRLNPQSWNAYSYSLNNPLSLTDPTGLYVCEDRRVAHPTTPPKQKPLSFRVPLARLPAAGRPQARVRV